MDSKSYFVLNIREFLGTPAEKDLSNLKDQFECPINKDIEIFLKNSAVDFAKKHQAVSYLVFSKQNGAFLGYFSLAIKTIAIKITLLNSVKELQNLQTRTSYSC